MDDFFMDLFDTDFIDVDAAGFCDVFGEQEFCICNIETDEVDDSFDAHNELGNLQTYEKFGLEVISFSVYIGDIEVTHLLTPKAYSKIEDKILEKAA